MANWRYIIAREVDRIAIPRDQRGDVPTCAIIIEEILPENISLEEVIQIMEQKYLVESTIEKITDKRFYWRETHQGYEIYLQRCLYRINLEKRHKNVWEINQIYLNRKKDGHWYLKEVGFESSLYNDEAICNAVETQYFQNQPNRNLKAGWDFDYITGKYEV